MTRSGNTGDLGSLTWVDLDGDRRLLVVPVGSCEQHGPHLPLDTDTLIAQAFAADLAAARDDTLVAPALSIGASGEHRGFPGTLSIGTAAMTSTLVELARSALPEPGSGNPGAFSAVLFVNAHGGNLEALEDARSTLAAESRRADFWHPRVDGGDPHAGATETSLMLHLHPERVRMELAEPGSTARFSDIRDELTAGGLAAVTPNGVLGDPTTASADAGARLFGTLRVTLSEAAERLL
ncbi:MAG: mycofactocin biosynthesis peptidyl-dipeptidase MftE [Microthrixaceae bacterium]|nr:mycofactocin biosynthesis peptidyl-dipeptidase MftE [Microthrixaceae bacterium]